MKKQFKLGVIGCSFFSNAILRGVVLSDLIREKKIIVSDENEEELDKLDYLGVRTTTNNRFVAENSEYLLFAVKPKKFDAISKELEGIRPEKVISVIEGLAKSSVKNALGVGVIKVARVVLNLPCEIGSGAIGIDMVDFNKSTDDCDFLSSVFGTLGTIVSVEESKLNAVYGLSGSGSVYSFMFIDALIDAGMKQGLTKNEAKILAVQTVLGSAEMVQREENTVEELTVLACNKGGAAVDAVKVLEEKGFVDAVSSAVEACVNRAKEQTK
ncbi:MAG: NAD(P)-binding domain-containing protein [Clostridia bacterium]|nr:NAD(P)-binding domain-containing protein [Clostridia bacterium]